MRKALRWLGRQHPQRIPIATAVLLEQYLAGVFAVLNALRVAVPPRSLSDYDHG